MARISDSFIQELLARADIVELISSYMPLKKTGANYSGLCPFHSEKTPSFTVSAKKQFYHCFGCGVHGDAINFISSYQKLDFIEALEVLASRYGMVVPRDNQQERNYQDIKDINYMLKLASVYYSKELRKPVAANCVNYLKLRGVSGLSAKNFILGYAAPGWSNLYNHLGVDFKSKALLKKAGLVLEGNKGFYDRFRDRLVFPIRDPKGRVIGFGGRVLDDSMPKYLNSPQTEVFNKSEVLYGLYEALSSKAEFKQAIIVEGYMDVIALNELGVHGALATLGTALTEQHLQKLFKYDVEVIFCFDSDRAGHAAATKAMETTLPLLKEARQIRFMFLPEGQDPDSFIRDKGRDAFYDLLGRSYHLSDFLFHTIMQQLPNGKNIEYKAKFVQIAKRLFSMIPEGIFREMMVDKLSSILKIKRYHLTKELFGKAEKKLKEEVKVVLPKPLAIVVGLLCINPKLTDVLVSKNLHKSKPYTKDMHLIISLVDKIIIKEVVNREQFICEFSGSKTLQELITTANSWLEFIPQEVYTDEFIGALDKLAGENKLKETQVLLEKSKSEKLSELEQEKLSQLLASKE